MKIYDLYKVSYLIMHGVNIKLEKEGKKIFAIVDEDVSDILNKYDTDLSIHQYKSAHFELRKMIKEIN